MNKKITACECDKPGWCERHQCHKTPHMHKLCMYHIGYFNLWENCMGPNQDRATCVPVKQKENQPPQQQMQAQERQPQKKQMALPPVTSQIKNFIKSAAKHAASGFSVVPEEEYTRRLEICKSCEFLTPEFRCAKCGCFMKTKTKWTTSSCPIGKWGPYVKDKNSS